MLSLICMCTVWSLLSPLLLSLPCQICHSNPCPPPQPLFFICHVCYVVSILHTAFYKQKISAIMSSFRALFSPSGLSTFRPSPAISITFATLTLFSPLGQPRLHYVRYTKQPPPLHLRVYRPPLNCHTCYFFVSPSLCLFLLRCCGAQPFRWICNCESERALRWILNPKPRQTFLPWQNLFISESPPSPVLQATFAHLTSSLAAVWLCWQQLRDEGRVAITFSNVLFPPVHPKAYPLANHSFAQK